MSLETMTKLQTVSVGVGGTSSIDFTNIPQTFTDLVICLSIRDDGTGTSGASYIDLQLNNSTGTYTVSRLLGAGSASVSNNAQTSNFMSIGYMGNSRTSMTSAFTNAEIYIPNYSGFNEKTVSCNYSMPDSSTGAYSGFGAGRWNQPQPITSIKIKADGQNITQHSTAILYGIKNARQTAGNSIKATGGNIVFDGTYVVHTFNTSGSFTPTQPILVDYLVVAGGGGGGSSGGGGGAGGYLTSIGGSTLSLAVNTAFTVTVGAGGAGGPGGYAATSGTNSIFSTVTATGGGAGCSDDFNIGAASGGSGGGGGLPFAFPPGGAASPSGQGNAGGNGGPGGGPGDFSGGGGGGAGSVGSNGETNLGGNGGSGLSSSITGTAVTLAGGGGGACGVDGTPATGGSGGGGRGGKRNGQTPTAGTSNTGGGGGSGGSVAGSTGGSGVVIIRYKG